MSSWATTSGLRISIFLNVFNVHVNRSPISGVLREVKYVRGKFVNAMSDLSADQNEQNIATVEGDDGQRVIFKQIAGLAGAAHRFLSQRRRSPRTRSAGWFDQVRIARRCCAGCVRPRERENWRSRQGRIDILAYLQPRETASGGHCFRSPESALMAETPPRPRRRITKGMYILPSLFTTANVAFGYYAILEVMHASAIDFWHLDNAAKAIGFAVLFDGLDGRIARMTGTSSDFGRELDSLADVITFGVAPAMLAWTWGFHLMPPVFSAKALAHQADAAGRHRQLPLPDRRSEPPGAIQYQRQSAALKPGPPGQEVFRRHADSRRSRRDRCRRALSRRRAAGCPPTPLWRGQRW